MTNLAVVAGLTSTTLFVGSYLPMLYRAVTTRDLRSYSRPSLVLANVGNAIYAVYVYSLPVGPIWFLHGFYLAASAFMLSLHLRHIRAAPINPGDPAIEPTATEATATEPTAAEPAADHHPPSRRTP